MIKSSTNSHGKPQHPMSATFAALLVCACVGCGGGLSGTYTPNGRSFAGAVIGNMTFNSSDKVEITALGTTAEGTYVLEGKRVKITVSGDTTIMTIDDQGCLDAGGMLGKFCRK